MCFARSKRPAAFSDDKPARFCSKTKRPSRTCYALPAPERPNLRSEGLCALLEANVLLHSQTPNAHGFAAKLADFGASVRDDMEIASSENNSFKDTFTHVAPEVVDGQPCSKVGRSLGPADHFPTTNFLRPRTVKPLFFKLSGGGGLKIL